MNNVTCVLLKMIKKEGWSALMLFRRMKRMPQWLLMMCALTGSGYATAADVCSSQSGNISLQLPLSVTFPPGGTPDESRPLFTGSTYSIQYSCTSSKQSKVYLFRLNDFSLLLKALDIAGLQLRLHIRDSSDNQDVIWTPSLNSPLGFPFGSFYSGDTGKRTVYITPLLYLTKTPTAGFSAVPPLTAFEIGPGYQQYNGPWITTSPVRIQYVPTCFVKTSLETSTVNFGPVITSDVNQSLSVTRPFKVSAVASNESSCAGDSNLRGYYSAGNTKYYLNLPLKVTFFVNSGGVVSGRDSIRLYKDGTSDENGLQLKIYDSDNNAVVFNEDSTSPANKLGKFDGTPGSGGWKVTKQYTAALSSTGERVLTGKYNAKVTVKVSYY